VKRGADLRSCHATCTPARRPWRCFSAAFEGPGRSAAVPHPAGQNLNISIFPLAEITAVTCRYIEPWQETCRLEASGRVFLVDGATLAEITSQALLLAAGQGSLRNGEQGPARGGLVATGCRSTSASTALNAGIDTLPAWKRDVWPTLGRAQRKGGSLRALAANRGLQGDAARLFKDSWCVRRLFRHHPIQRGGCRWERGNEARGPWAMLGVLLASSSSCHSSKAVPARRRAPWVVTITFAAPRFLEIMARGADRHRAGAHA